MRVVVINDSDYGGGASIATYRNFLAIRKTGIDAKMFVQTKTTDDKNIIAPRDNYDLFKSKYYRYVEYFKKYIYTPQNKNLHSMALISSININRLNCTNPDIVNLNWICNGFVKPEDFKEIRQPIVWTMHDTWAFCGSEHYLSGSRRYIDGYLKSNRNSFDRGFDLDRWVWNRKVRSWKNLNLVLVSPSRWLAECAKKSYLFKDKRIEVIPNCLDIKMLLPVDKKRARKKLNLNINKRYILFGAINAIDDSRKGFNYLKDSINMLENKIKKEVELMIFGQTKPIKNEYFGLKTNNFGRVIGDENLKYIYSAADVFVAPSKEDNLPNTIMEALSCGTPCVAFNIGGISDMIDHKNNGYLAIPYNARDLCDGILWILDNNIEEISKRSRLKVINSFTEDIVGKKYKKLYYSILNKRDV